MAVNRVHIFVVYDGQCVSTTVGRPSAKSWMAGSKVGLYACLAMCCNAVAVKLHTLHGIVFDWNWKQTNLVIVEVL